MSKCGIISIVGQTNVGKSTLLNKLLHQELSIVTPKINTTRDIITGVKMYTQDCQMIFQDTPGFIPSDKKQQTNIYKDIKDAIKTSDVILLLIDIAQKYNQNPIQDLILDYFDNKTILVLNKIDKIKNNCILYEKIETYKRIASKIKNKVLLSAKNDFGIHNLEEVIYTYLPEQNFFFTKESDIMHTKEFIISEKIREQILLHFSHEIPYKVSIEIENIKFTKGNIYISAILFVKKQSQKGILIGKNGKTLKHIGIITRKKLEEFFKKRIFLKQYVKIL